MSLLIQIAALGAIVVLGFCVAPGLAATIPRSSDIEASLAAIWSLMGPSDAARKWLAPLDMRATSHAALTDSEESHLDHRP